MVQHTDTWYSEIYAILFQRDNQPKYEKLLYLNKEGIISKMNTESIGWALVKLGCVLHNDVNNLDYSEIEIRQLGEPCLLLECLALQYDLLALGHY